MAQPKLPKKRLVRWNNDKHGEPPRRIFMPVSCLICLDPQRTMFDLQLMRGYTFEQIADNMLIEDEEKRARYIKFLRHHLWSAHLLRVTPENLAVITVDYLQAKTRERTIELALPREEQEYQRVSDADKAIQWGIGLYAKVEAMTQWREKNINPDAIRLLNQVAQDNPDVLERLAEARRKVKEAPILIEARKIEDRKERGVMREDTRTPE